MSPFEEMKSLTVSIGIKFKNIHDTSGNFQFMSMGSGIIYSVNKNDKLIQVIITAAHVVKNIKEILNEIKQLDNQIFIRHSWADSISTDNYLGIPVNVNDSNIFFHNDSSIDLTAIVLDKADDVPEYNHQYSDKKISSLSKGAYSNAEIGDEIFVPGYPEHVSGTIFKYKLNVCILKKGIISWIINNPLPPIDKFIFIDSSVSEGNSGAPVFKITSDLDKFTIGYNLGLVGIVTDTFAQNYDLTINGETVTNKQKFEMKFTSGQAQILKAIFVDELIDIVVSNISLQV